MKKSLLLSIVMLTVVLVPVAMADMIFNLTAGNPDISGFAGPYATVDVALNSPTVATITFTSLTNNGNIYLFGAVNSVDVNVNATSFTLGTISGSNVPGFTPGSYSDGGSGHVDGWGVFNQTINSFDGFTHSADYISFTLTNGSGTWADAADVLTPNQGHSLAAAHIFVTSDPADKDNDALATGFAAGSCTGNCGNEEGPTPVPEPSSLLLIGSGTLLLSLALRRKRN